MLVVGAHEGALGGHELERGDGVRPQAVLAGELVERRPDPVDRRGVLVRLTRDGERLAEQSLRAVLAADEAFLEPLSARQRDSVAAALKLLLLRSEPG
jgi:DNA-binding MarR family transcriptional regulator